MRVNPYLNGKPSVGPDPMKLKREFVSIRLPTGERARLKAEAKHIGMKWSEYLRHLLGVEPDAKR